MILEVDNNKRPSPTITLRLILLLYKEKKYRDFTNWMPITL